MKIVTADDIAKLLHQWQSGAKAAAEVYAWAEERHSSAWDRESESVNEVLGELDMMDVNLVMSEDVPAFLEALYSEEASEVFRAHFASVDFASRRDLLRSDPMYAKFCQ